MATKTIEVSEKIDVIELTHMTIIKYHISLNETALLVIRDGKATLTVKRYGTGQ